jgi:hypothetical protein
MAVSLSFGKKKTQVNHGCGDEECPQHGHPHVHMNTSVPIVMSGKIEGHHGSAVTMKDVVSSSTEPLTLNEKLKHTYVDKDGTKHDADEYLHPKNWHNLCHGWEVDSGWWAPYVQSLSDGTVSQVLADFYGSLEDSFCLFCKNHLPEIISHTAPYPVPVNLLSVVNNGEDSTAQLQIGVITVTFQDWQLSHMKKKGKWTLYDASFIGNKPEPEKFGTADDGQPTLIMGENVIDPTHYDMSMVEGIGSKSHFEFDKEVLNK